MSASIRPFRIDPPRSAISTGSRADSTPAGGPISSRGPVQPARRPGCTGSRRTRSGWIQLGFPTAVAVFPGDGTVQTLAQRSHTVVRWTRYDRGGHFAARRAPDLLVDDVRAFADQLQPVRCIGRLTVAGAPPEPAR